jgi:hypothetical protein
VTARRDDDHRDRRREVLGPAEEVQAEHRDQRRRGEDADVENSELPAHDAQERERAERALRELRRVAQLVMDPYARDEAHADERQQRGRDAAISGRHEHHDEHAERDDPTDLQEHARPPDLLVTKRVGRRRHRRRLRAVARDARRSGQRRRCDRRAHAATSHPCFLISASARLRSFGSSSPRSAIASASASSAPLANRSSADFASAIAAQRSTSS